MTREGEMGVITSGRLKIATHRKIGAGQTMTEEAQNAKKREIVTLMKVN